MKAAMEGLSGWLELYDVERGKFEYKVVKPPAVDTLVALYDHTPGVCFGFFDFCTTISDLTARLWKRADDARG
jgi:hypothetical protein